MVSIKQNPCPRNLHDGFDTGYSPRGTMVRLNQLTPLRNCLSLHMSASEGLIRNYIAGCQGNWLD